MGEIHGQVAPRGTEADQPPRGAEDVAEVVGTLGGVLGQLAEIRVDGLSLGVGHVVGIGPMCNHS